MLQLLRLRELPMLLATARARGVGGNSRSRRGACSMCSFRFNCVKLLWQLLRLLPHLWQQFPALFMLGEKNKHSAHTNTHTLSHRHTHVWRARSTFCSIVENLGISAIFHMSLSRKGKTIFNVYSFHFARASRRLVCSGPDPLPQLPLHMPACSHSVWQSPPLVPNPDRERFIECS